jgi:hypothetical protein
MWLRGVRETLRFNAMLADLHDRKSRIREEYRAKFKEARGRKASRDEIEELDHHEHMEFVLVDDEISTLWTGRLFRQTDRYVVPLPKLDNDTMWEESQVTGGRQLSAKAINELRGSVHRAQVEASEVFFRWLAGLTGLAGALNGLAALLLRH